MTTEDNGNIGYLKPTLSSTEDLSEYTDADESMSAPTEFLAEFLSALMLKEYENALKYCKLILQYEPNNATAKEFYPLLLEKLKLENENNAESNETESEETSSSESDSLSSEDMSDEQEEDEEEAEEEEEEEVEAMNQNNKGSKGSSNGDNTTGSYSSLEDDEAVIEQLAALTAKYKIDNVNLGNGNKIYDSNRIQSTSIKYESSIVNSNKSYLAVENKYFAASSDSESPTEPVSQETIAMLRAKVVPN